MNISDEYSGLPVDIDLREYEDDVGGFWSICWDCTLMEKSSGNKLLSFVWMSTCILKRNGKSNFNLQCLISKSTKMQLDGDLKAIMEES